MRGSVLELLFRCLRKNSRERLRDIGDARFQLERPFGIGPDQVVSEEPAEGLAVRRVQQTALLVIFTALVSAIVTGTGVWKLVQNSNVSDGPRLRSMISLRPASRLSSGHGPMDVARGLERPTRPSLVISPDSRYLVYSGQSDSGNEQLYVRAIDAIDAKPNPGTEGGACPFISPDGKWVGYFTSNMLMRVALSGGSPMSVCEMPEQVLRTWPFGADWGPDHTTLFAAERTGLFRVDAAGGKAEKLTTLDSSEYGHRLPHILPGGDAVLFTVAHHFVDSEQAEIVVQSLKSGERRMLIQNGADARYVPTGHLVFMRGAVLMAVRFNLAALQITGQRVPIVQDVMQSTDLMNSSLSSFAGQFSFSYAGLLAYARGGVAPLPSTDLLRVDYRGKAQHSYRHEGAVRNPQLSPDGNRIAFSEVRKDAGVIIYDIGRDDTSVLTNSGFAQWLAWTPDGKRLTFGWSQSGPPEIFWQTADGSSPAEPLWTAGRALIPVSWSPDGRHLAFVDVAASTDIHVLRLSDKAIVLSLDSKSNEMCPVFSPDGKYLAYSSTESGTNQVYLRPFPGPGPVFKISKEESICPAWAPDGRQLFYVRPPTPATPKKVWMAVDTRLSPSFSVGSPRELFDGTRYPIGSVGRHWDVSHDRQKFLVSLHGAPTPQPVTELILVTNWFEELKRLCPTGK